MTTLGEGAGDSGGLTVSSLPDTAQKLKRSASVSLQKFLRRQVNIETVTA